MLTPTPHIIIDEPLATSTMTRLFENDSTYANRAYQLWLILIGAASNRQIVTYGMLAKILGYKGASPVISSLGHIMYWCRENGTPPLTVLVVNQETGEPGGGLTTGSWKDLSSVFQHPWYSIVPPTPEELAAAYKRGNQRAVEG